MQQHQPSVSSQTSIGFKAVDRACERRLQRRTRRVGPRLAAEAVRVYGGSVTTTFMVADRPRSNVARLFLLRCSSRSIRRARARLVGLGLDRMQRCALRLCPNPSSRYQECLSGVATCVVGRP